MKVIIQDAKTKRYFSANGRWVIAENDARDFTSLIQAYNFARRFTSRRFAVVLFSPDDNYRASIIEGEGIADDVVGEPAEVVLVEKASNQTTGEKTKSHSSPWSRFNDCMVSTRNYLN